MDEAARTRTVNVCVLLTDLIDADNAEPGLHRTPAKRTRLARPSVRDHQKRGSTGVLWDLPIFPSLARIPARPSRQPAARLAAPSSNAGHRWTQDMQVADG
jgi:hypothetical protein